MVRPSPSVHRVAAGSSNHESATKATTPTPIWERRTITGSRRWTMRAM